MIPAERSRRDRARAIQKKAASRQARSSRENLSENKDAVVEILHGSGRYPSRRDVDQRRVTRNRQEAVGESTSWKSFHFVTTKWSTSTPSAVN